MRFASAVRTICLALLTALPVSTAQAQVRIQEVLLVCADGFPQATFVELLCTSPTQRLDSSIRLRVYNSDGSLRMNLGLSNSPPGPLWGEGRTFLFASSGFEFTTGVPPDAVMGMSLPGTAGSIRVIWVHPMTGVESVLDWLDYSPGGLAQAPQPGRSLTRDAFGRWTESADVSPTNLAGVQASAPQCFSITPPHARIREVQWQCPEGGLSSQFLELAPRVGASRFDRLIGVRATDRNGTLLFERTDLFGTETGRVWEPGTPWLMGHAALRTAQGATADIVLPVALDTLAGRIDLYWMRTPSERIGLDSILYGPGTIEVPPPGSSLQISDVGYTVSVPSPQNHSLALLTDQRCGRPDPIPLTVSEFTLQCLDGGTGRAFVEAIGLGASPTWARDVVLELRGRGGELLERVEDPFAGLGTARLASGQHWLIGSPTWRSASGQGPDHVRTLNPDTLSGEIRVLAWDRLGQLTPQRVIPYGTIQQPRPGPGGSLVLSGESHVPQSPPTPTTRSGALLSNHDCRRPITSRVRISEFQLMCTSGEARGQFVELIAMSEGESFDPELSVRIFDRNGVLTGQYSVTPPSLGSPWSAGRRWLLARPEYALGFDRRPDRDLMSLLDPVAGRIDLVGRSGSVAAVLHSVSYGGTSPAPPPGASLESLDGESFSVQIEPSPTNHAGVRLSASACLGPAPSLGLSEFLTGCASGESVSLVELTVFGSGVAADNTLHLRTYDAAGDLLWETPLTLGVPSEQMLGVGSRWLLADDAASTRLSLVRDQQLPVALDPAGGRLAIVRRNLLGSVTLDSVAYGSGALPAPTPGISLARAAGGAWAASTPDFASRNGTRVASVGCFDQSLAQVRLQSISLQCADGGTATQFIHLISEGSGLEFFSELLIRILDRNGEIIRELTRPFGESTGQPWLQGTSWAMTAHDYRKLGCLPAPDFTFEPELDLVAGAVQVVVRYPSHETVLDELRYGLTGEPPAPPPGQSLTWNGIAYVLDASPELFNRRDTDLPLQICAPDERIATITAAGLGCVGGNALGQFIELRAENATLYDRRMALEVFDIAGALVWRSTDLVLWFDGMPWPAGRHHLVGHTLQAVTLGRCVDSYMPAVLPAGGGVIELVVREPRCRRVLSRFDYRPLAASTLPGQGWRRMSDGSIAIDPAPRPKCTSGDSTSIVPCYDLPTTSRAVVQEMLLQDVAGATSSQFIELSSSGAGELFDGNVGLRTFDRNGVLLQDVLPEQLPLASGLWLPGRTRLLERGTFIGAPSLRLLAALDTLAGAIEVTHRSGGATSVRQRLTYGAGGEVTAPTLGRSIQRLPDGAYSSDASPSPQSGDTTRFSPAIHAGCGSGVLYNASGLGVEHAGLPVYARSHVGMPVTLGYDLQRGRVWADVGPDRSASALARDSFIVWVPEPAPATIDVLVRVRAEMTIACAGMECGQGSVTVTWASSTVSHTLQRTSDGGHQVDYILTVVPNVPFHLQFLVQTRSTHCLGPWASVRGMARWAIHDLPAEASVTSCAGYTPGDPTAAQLALLSAEAFAERNVLAWQVSTSAGFVALLERRAAESDWLPIAELMPDGSGVLRYEDTDVRPGTRHAYRLRWTDPDVGVQLTPEVVLVTPSALRFALHAIHPNPAVDGFAVELELAEPGDVVFEVLDIAGRRVMRHSTRREAGRQQIRLEGSAGLPTGSYVVRVRQGERSATKRVIVAR